jgi:transcriptional regulator with XRE-family HTH domain
MDAMNTATPKPPDFPALLRRLRERGWTQMQLAVKAGVSQATISELSSGKIPDPRHSLARTIEWLDAVGEPPPKKKQRKQRKRAQSQPQPQA